MMLDEQFSKYPSPWWNQWYQAICIKPFSGQPILLWPLGPSSKATPPRFYHSQEHQFYTEKASFTM